MVRRNLDLLSIAMPPIRRVPQGQQLFNPLPDGGENHKLTILYYKRNGERPLAFTVCCHPFVKPPALRRSSRQLLLLTRDCSPSLTTQIYVVLWSFNCCQCHTMARQATALSVSGVSTRKHGSPSTPLHKWSLPGTAI